MECSQIRRKLCAFMDGEMDGTTSQLIEEHLDGCRECLEYLHGFRQVDERLQGVPKIDLSPDFSSRVVSAAIQTPDVEKRKGVRFTSSLKQAVMRLSEAVFSLLGPGAGPSTRTLDEFSDCPPLSMSSIYFKLLDQGSRGY
jgi:predicted anti-sigma-YlaC factor YlaD